MAHERTEQPVVNRDESSHEQSMLNEVNMDFRIPGMPHVVVTQTESSRVRELVKKIENPSGSTCSSTRSTTKRSRQPVHCEVKADDSGRGQRRAVWIVRDGPYRRSAKHAYHTGVKALSIAHTGISWKKQRPIEVSLYIRWTFFFQFQKYVIKTGRPHGHRYGKLQEDKEYHLAHNLKKEMHQGKIHINPWSFLTRSCFPWTDDRKQSRWRCLSCMGHSCRTRSHLSNVRIWIFSPQAKLVDLPQ